MMDQNRFDTLARSAVTSPSRRLAIPAMLAALVGLPRITEAHKDADEKEGRKHAEAKAKPGNHTEANAKAGKHAAKAERTAPKAEGSAPKAERSARLDTSKFKREMRDGKLLKQDQDTSSGGDGAQAEADSIRQIYYAECSTKTGRFCGVSCPLSKQAIGGGVLDMTPNALLLFDRPGGSLRQWLAAVISLDGETARAQPYVVCLNK